MTCEPNTIQNSGDGSSHGGGGVVVTCTEMLGEAVRGGRRDSTDPASAVKEEAESTQPYKGKVVPCCICLQRELKNEIKRRV